MIPRGLSIVVVVVVACALAACSTSRGLALEACDGSACAPRVHAAGILDVASDDFHGKLLQRQNWSFALCANCHGDDFKGGAAKVSCIACHTQGVTACVTCHGATGPTTNAHQAHRSKNLGCENCHVVPTSWDMEGHILANGVAITTPPKVVFGALAQTTLVAADRAGPPTWTGQTCENVYCHGAVLHQSGGVASTPRWDDPTPVGSACDRCHGNPPPSHARSDCKTCHPANAPHVDGTIQIGRTSGCDGCHGSANSPAPPTDLAGNQFTTAIGVGAHQAHLQGPSRLTAPITCDTCHVVPATVTSVGHIDSGPPAEVNASLGWDRTSQTCATAYCHKDSRPVWTSRNQVSCGTCHGVPPADASHDASMTLSSCATCHPNTVDAFGNILVGPSGSKHINGIVDTP